MSVNGIGGSSPYDYAYASPMKSLDQTADTSSASSSSAASGGASGAAASLPAGNPLSAANAFQALNGLDVTGAVTATLPDGITLGVYSFAPNLAAESSAPFSPADGSSASPGSAAGGASASSSGSSASSSSGPDFAAMAAALEQMVDQFMSSGFGSSSASAAATAAYQQGLSNSSTQNGALGAVA